MNVGPVSVLASWTLLHQVFKSRLDMMPSCGVGPTGYIRNNLYLRGLKKRDYYYAIKGRPILNGGPAIFVEGVKVSW